MSNSATTQPNAPRLLYARKEAAYQLSISLRGIAYLIAEGRLRTRKIGGRTLIPHDELLRFSRLDRHDFIVTKRPKMVSSVQPS